MPLRVQPPHQSNNDELAGPQPSVVRSPMTTLTGILILTAVLAIAGCVMMVMGADARKRADLFRTTPRKSVVDTPGDGLVRIYGKVTQGEEGLVRVPILGREVVWYSLTILRDCGLWCRIHTQSEGRAFLVDDGSGQCAMVEPSGASCLADSEIVASCVSGDAPSEAFRSLLTDLGISVTSVGALNKSLRCEVRMIAPNDTIDVLGPSRRLGQGPNDCYRVNPSSQLVISLNPAIETPLYLSKWTEEVVLNSNERMGCALVLFVICFWMLVFAFAECQQRGM